MQSFNNIIDASEHLLQTETCNQSGQISGSQLLYTDKNVQKIQQEISKPPNQEQPQQSDADSTYSNSCNQCNVFATQKQSLKGSEKSNQSTQMTLENSTNITQFEESQPITRQFLSQTSNIDKPCRLDQPHEDDLLSTQIYEQPLYQTQPKQPFRPPNFHKK